MQTTTDNVRLVWKPSPEALNAACMTLHEWWSVSVNEDVKNVWRRDMEKAILAAFEVDTDKIVV